MSNKPMAYRLGLYISSAVLLVYSLFIIWVYWYNYNLGERDAMHKAMNINSSIFMAVREKLVSTQEATVNVSRQIPFCFEHGESEELLNSVIENYPHIWSVRVKLKGHDEPGDGRLFSLIRNGKASLFSTMPYSHEKCMEDQTELLEKLTAGKPFWTEPFRCDSTGMILSGYYFPYAHLNENGDTLFAGFVACQISLGFLQDTIEAIPKGENGFAFLISGSGLFITHPLGEYELTRSIYHLPASIYPYDSVQIAHDFIRDQKRITVYPIPLGMEKSWAYPTLIPETGWTIAFVMPYSEFYKDLIPLLVKMTLVSLLVALLIFVLVFTISRGVLKPISLISKEFHRFSIDRGEQTSKMNNEVVMLQESLIQLQDQYEKNLQSEKEQSQRRARFRADMQLASEIQRSFIPPQGNHFLNDSSLLLHAVYKPLQIVSGDLFDFFMIDEHKILVTIGDVSGGGVPAALFMGIAHTFIKSNANGGEAKEIVSQVNKLLCRNNANQFFLSLFLGIFDLKSETLNYCNAGHNPSFLIKRNGRVSELDDPHGLPLGLYPDRGYKDASVRFSKGDVLIMYTDGLSEQMNEVGEYFGADGFYRIFNRMKNHTPEEIAGMILDEVNGFAGTSAQSDDLCLLVYKHT